MSSIQSLPNAGTWNWAHNSLPTLRGTDGREQLNAVSGQASVLVGGGGGDQLVGAKGANTFRYEHATDSLSDEPDMIFNFNPKEDEIDVADMLKENNIAAINIQDESPKNVGDVQIKHDPFGVSTLTIKVSSEGPDFSVRVDNVKLLPKHVNFFNRD